MQIKEIKNYGRLNNNPREGTVEDTDTRIYLCIRHKQWWDTDHHKWWLGHHANEGFTLSCYDDGQAYHFSTIEELIRNMRDLIEKGVCDG